MIIVQDTREQTPLDFSPWSIKHEVVKLESGDYSLKGKEDLVCIERKSIQDLVNTLIHARERFAAELDRMKKFRYAAILVEGTWRDIHMHRYRSKAHPNAVRGIIAYIWVRTGIPTFFCDDAEMSAAWLVSTFRQIEKKEEKNEPSDDSNKSSATP